MKIIRRYSSLIFLTTVVLASCYSSLFGQDKKDVYDLSVSDDSRLQECISKFDINNLNFEAPAFKENTRFLTKYFQCKAAIQDNINECDKLKPDSDGVNNCRSNFQSYHAYFGRLLSAGTTTPKILAACKDRFRMPMEECKAFSQAILSENTSICTNSNKNLRMGDCMAIIKGDSISCLDAACKDKAYYIKALKNSEINYCDSMTNVYGKIMCQAAISGDENLCENNEDYKEFKRRYCESIIRTEIKEGRGNEAQSTQSKNSKN